MLKQPEKGGVVQHCAVSKCRTGVGSSLVLFALGADLDTAMADYLLINKTLAHYREYLLNEHAKTMTASVVKKFEYVYSVREDFLMAAINTVNMHYGSVDKWLEKDFALDSVGRSLLQSYFIE